MESKFPLSEPSDFITILHNATKNTTLVLEESLIEMILTSYLAAGHNVGIYYSKIIDKHNNITIENNNPSELIKEYEKAIFAKLIEQNETIKELKNHIIKQNKTIEDMKKEIEIINDKIIDLTVD